MTSAAALAFVRKHGVVLVSAKGRVPTLTHAIAGEPIKGSWWGHPKGGLIFRTLESMTDSPDVVVCRLVDDKLTLVHRRLWPALGRLAGRFPAGRLAQVRQEHTAAGHHANRVVAFPIWVPSDVARKAKALTEGAAGRLLEGRC